MKTILQWIAVAVMLLMLTACGEAAPAAEETARTTSADKTGVTEKTEYDDGSYEISTYDGDGRVIKTELYDEHDTVIDTATYEYEKDEQGNVLKETTLNNGVKSSETVYEYGADGELYIAQGTEYFPDGSKEVYIYSEDGLDVTTENRDADGRLTAKNVMTSDEIGNSVTVYYDGDGDVLKTEKWEVKEDRFVFTEFDADGNTVSVEEIPAEGGFGDEGML